MDNEVFFLCPFDLNTRTGTPTRTRTTIEAAKKIAKARVLSTAPYNDDTVDFTGSIDGISKSGLAKNSFLSGIKKAFQHEAISAMMLLSLLKQRPKKMYAFHVVAGFSGAIYKILSGAKLIVEVHAISGISGSLFLRICEWVSVKKADRIVAPSRKMKEYFISRYKIREEKITVAYGPVKMPKITAAKNKKGNIVFGYGGNDFPHQGIETLLEAAEIALEKNKGIKFIFVGFEPAKYRKYIGRNLEIIPQQDDEKFMEILSRCDVLICGYKGRFAEYTYPHKVSTYLSLGRPVICTSTGDLKEIIEGNKCGKTFEEDSPGELSGIMLDFAGTEKKKLDEMGRNARAFAEKELSESAFKEKLSVILGA